MEIFNYDAEVEDHVHNSRNISLASVLFLAIKNYSFFHSGRVLVHAISYAIQNDIPNVVDYLDNRFKQTKFRSQHQKQIKNELMIKESGDEYGVIEVDSCTQKIEIERELFMSDGALMPTDLLFFDIPLLF